MKSVNNSTPLKFAFLGMLMLIFNIYSFAQISKHDSLLAVLKVHKADTVRINALNALGWSLKSKNTDTSIVLLSEALSLSIALNDSVSQIKNLAIKSKDQFKKILAKSYHNRAYLYYMKGNYPMALDYDFKSMKIREDLKIKYPTDRKNKLGISASLTNIGIFYDDEGDYPKALQYYFLAKKIDEELDDPMGVAADLVNVGIVYREQGENEKDSTARVDLFLKSLKTYEEVLAIDLKHNDDDATANTYGNLGNIYNELNDFENAARYYQKTIALTQKTGQLELRASAFGNLGELNFSNRKYKEAEFYLTKGIALSDSIGDISGVMEREGTLSNMFSELHNTDKAFEHYKNYIAARDSIFTKENAQKSIRTEMNYEFDRKETAAKAEQDKKDAKALAEKEKQKIITYSIAAGLFFVLIFAIFIFKSYQEKQKANLIILKQKHIVEEKQKEILDSIYYARRIQRALLPTEKYIEKSLKNLNKEKKD